jgi:hypothetical protein
VIALSIARFAFDRFARRLYGASPLSIVLILDGDMALATPGVLLVNAQEVGLTPDIRDPLMLDRLGRFLQHADRVIVACAADRRSAWAMALKGANIQGEILDPELGRLGVLGTGRYGNDGTLVVAAGALGLRKPHRQAAAGPQPRHHGDHRRGALDGAGRARIKLEDRGPVLFVQERLGAATGLFNVYKFRSMKVAQLDRAGNQSTQRDDARITRVGRFIRKTSIDELPQLLNILFGSMSFVGPPPARARFARRATSCSGKSISATGIAMRASRG